MLVVVGLCWMTTVAGQQRDLIQEVRQKTPTVVAPKECLATFRAFFSYLQKNEPSIERDEQAQKRWLTEQLRKAFIEKMATLGSPQDNPDYPSNNTFLSAWDPPTTYSIIASRRYGERAVIDVLYKWGPNTNYQGDERITSFIFLLEEGKWKLDDIYTFGGKFVRADSLNQYFRGKETR